MPTIVASCGARPFSRRRRPRLGEGLRCAGRLVGSVERLMAGRGAQPDAAVREALGLPDGRSRLELLDGVAAGLEGLLRCGAAAAMATLASPTATSPTRWTMASRCTPKRASISSAISAEDGQRHGLEGLVGEADDALAGEAGGLGLLAGRGRPGRLARLAQEDDDGTIGRRWPRSRRRSASRLVGQRGRDDLEASTTGVRRQLDRCRAARPPSALPPATGGMTASSSPGASRSSRST